MAVDTIYYHLNWVKYCKIQPQFSVGQDHLLKKKEKKNINKTKQAKVHRMVNNLMLHKDSHVPFYIYTHTHTPIYYIHIFNQSDMKSFGIKMFWNRFGKDGEIVI